MKKIVTLFLGIVALLCVTSNSLMAQNDTLNVYSSVENLETIIMRDTTAAGLQNHKVYKLVSLDTTYVFGSTITVKSDFELIGVLDPDTKRPPAIQPISQADGSLPNNGFMFLGEDINVKFKNLYLTGRSTDNTINSTNLNGGAFIQLAAKNIRLQVDNVVFADWPSNNIGYSADGASIFIYNSKFRNAIAAGAYYSGEGVRNTYNTAVTDSMVVKNCTFFCINAYAACPVTVNPVTYFEFSNNNVMYTFKNPFWIYNITDGRFNNNLFYGCFAGASTVTEHEGMWDQLRSFARTSILDLDSLTVDFAKMVNLEDSADANVLALTEAKRNIEVRNNFAFQPQTVLDLWASWNDTASAGNEIITPEWMNDRTKGMFADKSYWPGLVEEGNIEGVDPQFGSSIDDIMYNNTGSDAGLIEYFYDTRHGISSTKIYGYKLPTVEGNWIPEWPLPEVNDMQYANSALLTGATDGKEIGDRTWFNNGLPVNVKDNENNLPEKFTLENAYPNPFNPSTNIKFNLASAGNIDLKIYNVMGQLVKTVFGGELMSAGTYEYKLAMDNFASGIYLLTLSQGNQQLTQKLVLLK